MWQCAEGHKRRLKKKSCWQIHEIQEREEDGLKAERLGVAASIDVSHREWGRGNDQEGGKDGMNTRQSVCVMVEVEREQIKNACW